jgi:hypothetical protein
MTPQDEREALIAAVRDPEAYAGKQGWRDVAQWTADAILALRQPGAEYRRGVEDAARYVEGHGGVIPGSTVFASLITGDRMPCMSGDGRDKMMPHKRRYFDDATRDLATAIRALTDAKEVGGG